jgi:hypothetical protein
MDVLNFISWIKNGQQVTTVDPTQTLMPLGLRDPRRDDGYLSVAITAQDFIDQVVTCIPVPPSLFETSQGGPLSTVRTGYNSYTFSCGVNLGFNSTLQNYWSFIGGGGYNCVNSCQSALVGGIFNRMCGSSSFLGGGELNSIESNSASSVINGGCANYTAACMSVINGGCQNTVANSYSIINGGCRNTVNGTFSAVIGGKCNNASCNDSFIAGSCITANRVCTTFVNNLSIMNVPTSSAGLPSKAVWSNSGILTIVP